MLTLISEEGRTLSRMLNHAWTRCSFSTILTIPSVSCPQYASSAFRFCSRSPSPQSARISDSPSQSGFLPVRHYQSGVGHFGH